jgi:hypothetical protein
MHAAGYVVRVGPIGAPSRPNRLAPPLPFHPSSRKTMLETFTMETFQPRLGELFTIVVDEETRLPTKLTAVFPWGDASAQGRPRAPFSLFFHTVPQAVIPQQIYRVENDNMEPFDLFLTPIGPDEHGMRYEAVFT